MNWSIGLSQEPESLTKEQMGRIAESLHHGADEASRALGTWLNASVKISIDSVDQCALRDATGILGAGDSVICMCLMEMQGTLTGHMLLAFDDASGLAVTDLLLGRPSGTADAWGELERSCILETMNIAGSAYLNGIARYLSDHSGRETELLPAPPCFMRDFTESLLEAAFFDQAIVGNDVVFALARFDLSGMPLRWSFLLIPDPPSLRCLGSIVEQLT